MNKSLAAKTKYKNSDITVIALYQLGAALRYIHLEDVALKAAELSPKTFSWKKFPEQINLETVRLALKNELRLPNSRVQGSIREGWMLTSQGLLWCLGDTTIVKNKISIEQINKEIARFKNTETFGKILNNDSKNISDGELKLFLRIDDYFSLRNRKERVAALMNATVVDSSLKPVLDILKQRRIVDPEVKL